MSAFAWGEILFWQIVFRRAADRLQEREGKLAKKCDTTTQYQNMRIKQVRPKFKVDAYFYLVNTILFKR